jgi:glycosyltransferase involved in cell wall biosynthesis
VGSRGMSFKITIGITAWNEGEWLRECWESVLKQTNPNWEAVMVLDGGADRKTSNVFENIKHERLKKIKLDKNVGPYPARTMAIESATTPWFYPLVLYNGCMKQLGEIQAQIFYMEIFFILMKHKAIDINAWNLILNMHPMVE